MNIKDFFALHSEVAVAFSGGVDSAVLLLLAKKYAKRVKAYYVSSQFQPRFELEDAKEVAALLGAELELLKVDILAFSEVTSNPENRCYLCKTAIFNEICNATEADGFSLILDGTNASDDVDDRPGMRVLAELSVLSPLRICGFKKSDVRTIARENGLPVADKPSYACLATRVPYHTQITAEILEKTENCESELRALGYKNFRARYADGKARLELSRADLANYGKVKRETEEIFSKYYDGYYLDPKERNDE